MQLGLGTLFVECGQLYVVNGWKRALLIDDDNQLDDVKNEVHTDGCDYKHLGYVLLGQNIVCQKPYWIARSNLWRLKFQNEHKKNNNITNDEIINIQNGLLHNIKCENAGTKLNIYINKIGKTKFNLIKKKLKDKMIVIGDWKINKVTTMSPILNKKQIGKLYGGKNNYPIVIGDEILTLEGARFVWWNKNQHIRNQQLRLECHVVSTNKTTKRVIGRLEDKKQKGKAKKKKKLHEKKEKEKQQRREKERVLITKKGQLFVEPDKYEPSHMFYESLYQEDAGSIMSISYLLYFGCFQNKKAERLYNKCSESLLKPNLFFFDDKDN